MRQWTRTRKLSFAVHVVFVAIPFLASSVSAFLLWETLFDSWLLALPMVAVIDVLALTGLLLFIARVPSPFVPLRRLLPFVSIVPLGRELYLLLSHNGFWLAAAVTILVVTILTVVAWQCFGTIERLFITPVEAAREKAREQLSVLSIELAQLTEKNAVVRDFVAAWQQQYQAPTPPPFRLEDFLDEMTAATSKPTPSKTQQVKQLAVEMGVSESTVWRRIEKGEIVLNGRP